MLRILRRRVQWTPQPTQPEKSPALFGLNFECLLKALSWFAFCCKWIDCILWSQKVLSFTYHTYQAGNEMFKVNSKNPRIRGGISWKLTRKTLERLVAVVQLLLTWNIFEFFFYCYCCWLWGSKCRLLQQHSK